MVRVVAAAAAVVMDVVGAVGAVDDKEEGLLAFEHTHTHIQVSGVRFLLACFGGSARKSRICN